MRLLLDTHALIWFLEDDPRLSLRARNGIESAENEKQVSVATGWEMAIKLTLGKLRLPLPFEDLFPGRLASLGFRMNRGASRKQFPISFLWLMCGAVLLAAILGKGVACWLAARATGISNREAMGIGTLMNARGLMELIIINIGLQRGVISEGLFATLVIMAVITTLMASPIFERLVGTGTYKPEPELEKGPVED